jgi:hypothetical protein
MIAPYDANDNNLPNSFQTNAVKGKGRRGWKRGEEPEGLRLKCCHWPLSIRTTRIDRDWYRFTLDPKTKCGDKK